MDLDERRTPFSERTPIQTFGLSFQSRKLRAKLRVLEISNAKSMRDW